MAITDAATQLRQMKDDHRANSFRNVDIRLSNLLDLIFDTDDSIKDGRLPLTVVADGAVISGTVVSEDAWSEGQTEKLDEQSPNFAEALRMVQDSVVKGRNARNEELKDSDEHRALRTKLHFEKATIIMGGTNVIISGLRVDLKHVAAWSLGTMSAPE